MQQGAQLCFNGNFLVDRSEYPPLASRVLTSSGVAALLRRRDAYAQDGAQGHLSSEGLGGDPKHRGAIRPKPQRKLSRMSQPLTIYTNSPDYKQPVTRSCSPKDLAIPRARHDAATIARELIGEVLGIADTEDLGRGIVPETPGREGDRGQQGFQIAGRLLRVRAGTDVNFRTEISSPQPGGT